MDKHTVLKQEELAQHNTLRLNRVAAMAGLLTVALGLSSCSGTNSSSKQTTLKQPITLTPDMSGFLKPGTNKTCFNGGARPCAVLIRVSPNLSSDYINADPTQGRVDWPLEAYDGQSGNSLTIQCYDPNGQTVSPYEGSSSSSDWYEVVVPQQYVLNPAVKAELGQSNSPIKTTIQQNGKITALGWASIEWFNESAPLNQVQPC